MRICLIKLPNLKNMVLIPDLGIGTLISSLRTCGYNADQVDLAPIVREMHPLNSYFKRISKKNLARFLGEGKEDEILSEMVSRIVSIHDLKKYGLIGFSMDTEANILLGLSLIKAIKEVTGCKTLIGGTFCNVNNQKKLLSGYHFIDYIIRGDAVSSIKKLVDFTEGKGKIEKILGLAYRQNSQTISNPYLRQTGNTNIFPDFYGLKMEDYLLLPNEFFRKTILDKLNDIGAKNKKVGILPINFIKGCPNSCTFCYWQREKVFECANPEDVAYEIAKLKKKHRIENFLFLNNSFNPTVEYGLSLLKSIKENDLNISWTDSAHPSFFSKEIIGMVKESGCKQLYVGLESGSQKMLELMNRPSNPEKFEPLLKKLHEQGVYNGVNFIVGLPHESFEDIEKTGNLIRSASQYFEFISINLLRVVPDFKEIRDPAKCGINLIKVGSTELRNENNIPETEKILRDSGIHKRVQFYSYDEIGRFKWKEKNMQDIKHTAYLLNLVDERKKIFFDGIHRIFYLSSIFSSKNEAIKFYESLKNEKGAIF